MAVTAIIMSRGNDRTFNVTVKDSSSVAIDITGYTIFFMVKENTNQADSLAKITKTAVLTDPTNGIATITIDAADTQDLIPKNYQYDIKIKDAGGLLVSSLVEEFKLLAIVKQEST